MSDTVTYLLHYLQFAVFNSNIQLSLYLYSTLIRFISSDLLQSFIIVEKINFFVLQLSEKFSCRSAMLGT